MKSSAPVEVLITLPFGAALTQKLQEVSERLRVSVHPAQKAEDVPSDLWARCEVLYTDHILPAPDLAPRLKWVQLHYAGVEHVMGAPLLARPDLLVTSLSGAAASQTAEHVLAMLLALARRLPTLAALQRKAEWPKDRWTRFVPRELRTSTVGILGYGSIGRQVARLLRAFDATVLATKFDAMQPADTGYTPEGMGDPAGDLVHRLYPAQAVKSMLKDCDFIVVALPLTPTTRGLLNAETLAACKPGACLVDVSRGGIVDHAALLKALQDHKLAGAALDVFPEEPLPPKSPLWEQPNLILTPHIAGISAHYDQRAMDLFAVNLTRYLNGQPPYNLCDPQRGY
ncbi:MAG: D-2-hydroxyacid dehydrogenase [Anaerolineales bacterium]